MHEYVQKRMYNTANFFAETFVQESIFNHLPPALTSLQTVWNTHGGRAAGRVSDYVISGHMIGSW